MLVYLTGPAASLSCTPALVNTGSINVGSSGNVSLTGAGSPYNGILFFMDRNAVSQSHSLGGGSGAMNLNGTIYLTDWKATMQTCSQFQSLSLAGTSGNSSITGNVIASALSMNGTSGITISLPSYPIAPIRQIALVQ
jgi:hypothetical protein